MADIKEIGQDLATQADGFARAAVDEWRKISEIEKWQNVPESYTWDSLNELVRALARAALLEPDQPDSRRHLIEIAVKHGHDRFLEGFEEALLYREYQMLRNAFWAHIRVLYGASGGGAEAIIRIDAVITMAVRGSIVGYHRPQLVEQGRYEAVFEGLLEGWPKLGR